MENVIRNVMEQDVTTGVPPTLAGQGLHPQRWDIIPSTRGSKEEQLVVPKQLLGRVLSMGLSIPWAGHLNHYKTYGRVATRCFRPGMYSERCRSSAEPVQCVILPLSAWLALTSCSLCLFLMQHSPKQFQTLQDHKEDWLEIHCSSL